MFHADLLSIILFSGFKLKYTSYYVGTGTQNNVYTFDYLGTGYINITIKYNVYKITYCGYFV